MDTLLSSLVVSENRARSTDSIGSRLGALVWKIWSYISWSLAWRPSVTS